VTERAGAGAIEVTAGDEADLEVLYAELRGRQGITADLVPAPPEPGDQGVLLALLLVALSSGAVTAFLEIVKDLIESRGPGFVLKFRDSKKKTTVQITADDAEAGLAALKELLDGS